MKTLHLSIITIVGITSLVLLGSYIFTNPTTNKYSGPYYTGEENRPYSYVIHEPYQGVDKNFGTVTIQNQTFHVSTVNSGFQNWTKPFWIDMYNVNFTFLNGYKPVDFSNGKIYWARLTFPDGTTGVFNANISKALGQPQYNFTTVLSNHTNPQAGFTVHDGKIQLLVNWPKIHSNLSILGINDTYRPGNPIDFQINANGFDYFDGGETPDINITRADGAIAWKEPQYLVMCCPSELVDYNRTFNLASLGGPVILNETGSYVVKARFNHQTIEKKFSVISQTLVHANLTNHIVYHRFYSASAPQLEYVLKQGQTMTIPVGIYYSEQNAVHLTTLTHVHYCGPVEAQLTPTTNSSYQIPKGCNLDPGDAMPNSPDISAEIDKKFIDLPATITNETTVRDTANLVVSSLQDARTGVYRITIGLTDDNEFHGGSMVYFEVN